MRGAQSSGLTIRVMQPDDVAFADAIRALAGWNQTLADWQRFLTCEPGGCFVAEFNGAPAGTATCTCYGTELGWIGMLLVHPDQRRRGIGAALMRHCLAYLEERGVGCIKLDATPLGQPLYEQLGFAPELSLTRWEAQVLRAVTVPAMDDTAPCSTADWEEVLALDERAFGWPRRDMLAAVAWQCCQVIVCRAVSGSRFGYGMLRQGSRASYLGPVAADEPAIASRIVLRLLSHLPPEKEAVFWDVLDQNGPATALAQSLGFTPQRHLVRMFRGSHPSKGDPQRQFAIVDPATG
jgi:GNAT superfamily N-acetyltransferase